MSVEQLRSSPLKSLLSRKAAESRSPVARRLARLGLRAAASLGSDTITFDAGGYSMLLPAAHPLPKYWNAFPNYDRALTRIVRSFSAFARSDEFVIVDIGANVGDTAIALLQCPASYVIAIEGNDAFLPYLRQNLSDFRDRSLIVDRFIGPKNAASFIVETSKGTAKLAHATDSAAPSVDMIGLEDALASTQKAEVGLIKIDTDGFDIQIIVNSLALLEAAAIPLFFEFDPRLAAPITGDAWTIFDTLHGAGYRFGIAYLNTGELLRSFEIADREVIKELRAFMGSALPSAYLDLLVVKDAVQFDHIRTTELSHFMRADPQPATPIQ